MTTSSEHLQRARPDRAAAAAAAAGEVVDAVSTAVVGKDAVLRRVLAVMLAGGHVLLEDVPGLGKTLMARSFAAAMGLRSGRIQFTPDLLPADVVGSALPAADGGLRFEPGPVFTQLLLADEVNRTPPKTQAALLEAMQERQVTAEGATHPLDDCFTVLATSNPVETEGTYPLPEAQLDRFLARLAVGYPEAQDESALVTRRLQRRQEHVAVPQVLDDGGYTRLRAAVEDVHVEPAVVDYAVALVRATRTHRAVLVGASPRASLALVQLARAWALMDGRPFVTPDDVHGLAPDVLTHRLTLRPEAWIRGTDPVPLLTEVVDAVPTPRITTPHE